MPPRALLDEDVSRLKWRCFSMNRSLPSSLGHALCLLLVLLAQIVPVAMGQANVPGQWSTLSYTMPINPIHAALLYNGNVLLVAGSGHCQPSQSICPSGAPYGPSHARGAPRWAPGA